MRVLTWNCQGDKWGDIQQLLTQADVVCLQECGAPPYKLAQDATDTEIHTGIVEFGTRKRGNSICIVYWQAPATRNGIAVLADSNMATGKWAKVPAPSVSLRPAVGLELRTSNAQRLRWVFSVHAPSGSHNAAAGVMNAMVKAGFVKYPKAAFAGDYNCPPQLLATKNTGLYKIKSSGLATRYSSGNELDFIVADPTLLAEYSDGGKVISDHAAVIFDVT